MAAGPGGTAPKAQAIGYSVGGKTGTAHKQEGKGYASNKYRAWFVGMAPIDNPRIVVAVMVDEPSNGEYYGGDVAAPVFSQVVQQTLRMMGVRARPRRSSRRSSREATPAGGRRASDDDRCTRLKSPEAAARWLQRVRSTRHAAHRQPPACSRATPSSPGRATRPTAGASSPAALARRRARPAWSRPRASRPSASTTRASRRCRA